MKPDSLDTLRAALGGMDIYLLDQLLRAKIAPDARVFDAGCGGGRNVVWFLRAGHTVAGVDTNPDAIAALRQLATELAPRPARTRFELAALEEAPFEDASYDLVICNALLHFARDETHFETLLQSAWRLVAPGGRFFARLASSIGLEARLERPTGRTRLPDQSTRYLVDATSLHAYTRELGGALVDPLKTTVVDGLRSMTTWVLERPPAR